MRGPAPSPSSTSTTTASASSTSHSRRTSSATSSAASRRPASSAGRCSSRRTRSDGRPGTTGPASASGGSVGRAGRAATAAGADAGVDAVGPVAGPVGGRPGRHGEPGPVGAVLLVAGPPGRREPRQQRQPAAVRGGAAVAAARLGQVLLQRPGTAVAHRDDDLGVVDAQRDLELGARVQHGVLAELAREQHDGVRGGVASRLGQTRLVERRHQHAPRQAGRPRVGRQPDSALQGHGHPASLHRLAPCASGAVGRSATTRRTGTAAPTRRHGTFTACPSLRLPGGGFPV